jgi:hypothetical protein
MNIQNYEIYKSVLYIYEFESFKRVYYVLYYENNYRTIYIYQGNDSRMILIENKINLILWNVEMS